MSEPTRRDFLKCSAGAALGMHLGAARAFAPITNTTASNASLPASTTLTVKKGLVINMLPGKMSYADRLKLARDAGFEVVQALTTPDERVAEEIQNAAASSGIHIDSVMNMAHWDYPLSSSDPAVVEKSMDGMRTSLHNAKLWESYSVLLVPAVVNPQTSYHDAWTRSQTQIRKLIPLARESGVVIAVEEVW